MKCSICGSPAPQSCPNCKRPLCYMCMPRKGDPCSPFCMPQAIPQLSVPTIPTAKPRSRSTKATSRPKQPSSTPRTRRKSSGPALTPQGVPYYVPSIPPDPAYQLPVSTSVDFDKMTLEELIKYVVELRVALIAKKNRERDYLDRRAIRSQQQYGGGRTTTDEAYERDQPTLDKVIKLLYFIEKQAKDELASQIH